MKKIDVGQSITILANLGVIAGIVFLAVEIQQNNELLAAQVRADRLESRSSPSRLELESVDIASINHKITSGQSLTPEEEYGLRTFVIYNFFTWEWQYDETVAGTIPRDKLPVGGWRIVSQRSPIWREAWDEYSDNPERSPDFVSFIEDNVFSRIE